MSPLRTGILKTKIGQESKIDQHVGQSHNADEKVVYTAVKARKWLKVSGFYRYPSIKSKHGIFLQLLNEFLRAASGSSLTDDGHDEPLLQSSPLSLQSLINVVGANENISNNETNDTTEFSSWSESLQEYLPFLVVHSSPLLPLSRLKKNPCSLTLIHAHHLTLIHAYHSSIMHNATIFIYYVKEVVDSIPLSAI